MLLFEAKEVVEDIINQIDRIALDTLPDWRAGLEIAAEALDKQMELADMFNDMQGDPDMIAYSKEEVLERLEQVMVDGD